MNHSKTKMLMWAAFAFGLCGLSAQAATYKEVGGVVVVEAEHFDKRKNSEDDDHKWVLVPDEGAATSEYQNARGGKYLQVQPDSGQNRNNPDLFPVGPTADYKVRITTTGEYRLWLRTMGFDGASDSMYASILELRPDSGGPGPANWYRKAPTPTSGDFAALNGDVGWDGSGGADVISGDAGGDPMIWNISKPGVYTVRVYQREDGAAFDAFVLQLSSRPDPPQAIPESPLDDAAPQPLSASVSPAPDSVGAPFDKGISATFVDGTTKLAAGSVVLELDGVTVTPTVSSQAGVTTVSFVPAQFFAPGSVHNAKVSYKDDKGASFSTSWTFTVRNYLLVGPGLKVTPDTNKRGFLWRIHQNNAAGQENTNTRTERQLAGLILVDGKSIENHADPAAVGGADGPAGAPNPSSAPITFEVSKVINFSQQEGENNGAFTPDLQMPGIPGVEGSTDSIAAEIITYLELPAGLIRMGVNSDDGFKTSIGAGGDVFAPIAGEFSGGRGAADTTFTFVVAEPGVYPFRTSWEEGGGGANIEWFTFKPGTNTKVLVNDDANGGVKAYRAASAASLKPVIKLVLPPVPATPAPSSKPEIGAVLVDGGATVDQASIVLTVNGQRVTPTVTKTGAETKVSYTPTTDLPSGARVSVSLTFKDSSGASRTETWSFQTEITTKVFTAGTLFIEAEDVDFGKGKYVTGKKIGMDGAYPGGAYAGLGTADDRGFDWNTNDNAGQAYRPDTGIAAGKENGSAGKDRGLFEVTTWWTVGWNDANEWYNYTREFPTPAKDYAVYGNLSSGGAPINIRLDQITAGRGQADSAQVKKTLGFFTPKRATTGWDNLEIFQLTDINGNPITVNLGGVVTLRTTILAGANSDQDYFAFVPSAPVGPGPGTGAKLTASRTGNTVRIEWTGGGALESADVITGPWTPVAGASSPATVTITGTGKFYRVRQ